MLGEWQIASIIPLFMLTSEKAFRKARWGGIELGDNEDKAS